VYRSGTRRSVDLLEEQVRSCAAPPMGRAAFFARTKAEVAEASLWRVQAAKEVKLSGGIHKSALRFGLLAVALSMLAAAERQTVAMKADASLSEVSILSATRLALGGEDAIKAVRSFAVAGRTRRLGSDAIVSIEFEIACELPDRFARSEEIPAQETGRTWRGFWGNDFVPVPTLLGSTAKPQAPPPATDARVVALQREFLRWTLGMFGQSFLRGVVFAEGGKATAPEGGADVVDVTGPGDLALRLFIRSGTHLPIMASWRVPPTNVLVLLPGRSAGDVAPGTVVVAAPPLPPSDASSEEREQYARKVKDIRATALTAAPPVEHRLYYSDYRTTEGKLCLPYRLRYSIAGNTVEETDVDSYRMNIPIDWRRLLSPGRKNPGLSRWD
jgi:hypothetical protein